MNLESHRLILQPVLNKDFEAVYDIFTNEFVRTYLFDNNILDEAQVKEFVRISNDTFEKKSYGLWLLKLRIAEQHIGFAGLWHFFEEDQPQLLYALLPDYTGQGLASEASTQIVNYSFEKLGLPYVDASCDKANIASHKTASRIGMKKFKEEVVDGKPLTFYRIAKK